MQSDPKSRRRFRAVIAWRCAMSGFVLLVMFGVGRQLRAADLFITDGDSAAKFDGATTTLNFVGPVGNPPLTNPSFGLTGSAMGPDGNLYVAASNPAEVYRVNPATGAQIGSGAFVPFTADNSQNVQGPEGMKFGQDGNLYITDVTTSNVNVYNSSGGFVGLVGSSLVQPVSLAFDSSGGLYVADALGIEKYNTVSHDYDSYIQAQTGGLEIASDLAFGPDGSLYIVDAQNDEIWRSSGVNDLHEYITFPFTDTSLFVPAGLAFDGNGNLFVSGINLFADSNLQGEVLEFDSSGNPLGAPVTGLNNPTFLTFTPEPSCIAGLCMSLAMLLRRRK